MQLTRLRVLLMLVLAVTSTGVLVWHFASAVPAPSVSSTVEPGSLAEPCFETLYVDTSGPTYLSKNGLSGGNKYSSTNPVTTFQNSLNDVVANHGNLCLNNGPWPFGTSQVTVTGTQANFSITFNTGSWIDYSGANFAIQIKAATRGSIKDFQLNNPAIYVTSTTGGAIQVIGGYQYQIVNPHITSSGIGIDLENTNTAKINGGGTIQDVNNVRATGTVGVMLAGNTTYGKGPANNVQNIEINVNQISGFLYDAQMGCYDAAAFDCSSLSNTIDNTYLSSAKDAIEYFAGNTFEMWRDYFEADTEASLNITNNGAANTPSLFNVVANNFAEAPGTYDVNCPGGSFNCTILNSYFLGNTWGAGNIRLNGGDNGDTIDITGDTGTITITAGAGNAVNLMFNPDPQTGTVTGISTASVTTVTGAVTFARAYPTGFAYNVQITINSLNSGVVLGGIWTSSVSNTGFTWNIKITTSVGATTCSLYFLVKLTIL